MYTPQNCIIQENQAAFIGLGCLATWKYLIPIFKSENGLNESFTNAFILIKLWNFNKFFLSVAQLQKFRRMFSRFRMRKRNSGGETP